MRGKLLLRWSRGPAVRAKGQPAVALDLDSDPLFDQVRNFRDEQGQALTPIVYRRLLAEHGRQRLQKHAGVIIAQKRLKPGSFRRSEIAALVDRVKHDHPAPSWYTPQLNRNVVEFDNMKATPAAQALYDSVSRAL
jgi:hypothetical protein